MAHTKHIRHVGMTLSGLSAWHDTRVRACAYVPGTGTYYEVRSGWRGREKAENVQLVAANGSL